MVVVVILSGPIRAASRALASPRLSMLDDTVCLLSHPALLLVLPVLPLLPGVLVMLALPLLRSPSQGVPFARPPDSIMSFRAYRVIFHHCLRCGDPIDRVV